jgi:hypothetical protein
LVLTLLFFVSLFIFSTGKAMLAINKGLQRSVITTEVLGLVLFLFVFFGRFVGFRSS